MNLIIFLCSKQQTTMQSGCYCALPPLCPHFSTHSAWRKTLSQRSDVTIWARLESRTGVMWVKQCHVYHPPGRKPF